MSEKDIPGLEGIVIGEVQEDRQDVAVVPVEKVEETRLEINIPEAVKRDLRRGVKEVIRTIEEEKPDAIVVLLRSGALAFAGVEACAEKRGMELPLVSYVYLSRNLMESAPQEEFPESTWYDAFYNRDSQSIGDDNYRRLALWIKGQPNGAMVIDELRRDAVDLDNGVKRVLIVDDTSVRGMTMVGATALVESAFGPETEISNRLVFNTEGEWVDSIILDNFPKVDALFDRIGEDEEMGNYYEAVTLYLKALVLGYDYGYVEDGTCVAFTVQNKKNIDDLAESIEEEYGIEDFQERFCQELGLTGDDIYHIHEQIENKFKAIGRKVKIR